jgi:hypothetical protein
VLGRHREHLALVHVQRREREVADGGPTAAMTHVAADQREPDVLALVQRGERRDPVRRRVVRDEEQRLQCSASS